MLVFKPLTQEDIKERVFPKIEKVVKDLSGSIKIRENMGKRLLAYEIDGNKEGFYLLCDLTLDSSNLSKFDKKLSLTSDLIRSLNIRKDTL